MKTRFLALAVIAAAFLSGYGLQSQSSDSEAAPRFDHLTLSVTDVAKSVQFYESVVGLRRIPDPFKEAGVAFLALNERDQLHLLRAEQPQGAKSKGVHFAIRVASVPAFQERLNQAHIRYEDADGAPGKVTLRPDGVHQIYFQDPDGYWIEINDRK